MPNAAAGTGSCRPVPEAGRGRLIIVGCGLQPSRHASARTVSEITRAQIVFVLADPFAIDWVRGFNRNVHNLGEFYDAGLDRRESYRSMQHAILDAVRRGMQVCVAFYGHPAVFVQVGRKAIAEARAHGFETAMEPGISAEACLYVDLMLDPGQHGVISIEATRFMIDQRELDPAALVLLWQIVEAGNLGCTGFDARPERLNLLVEKLSRWYPRSHPVILYEAATLPIQDFRTEQIELGELPRSRIGGKTTLVVPPAQQPARDEEMIARLQALDQSS